MIGMRRNDPRLLVIILITALIIIKPPQSIPIPQPLGRGGISFPLPIPPPPPPPPLPLGGAEGSPPSPSSILTFNIYSDSAYTTPITDISWGDLEPGGSTHQTVYIKNTSNVAATLSCTFGNWVPSGAASYITVTWDKEGASIAPNESVAATFTLTVSPSITGITTFSVQINISATQA